MSAIELAEARGMAKPLIVSARQRTSAALSRVEGPDRTEATVPDFNTWSSNSVLPFAALSIDL